MNEEQKKFASEFYESTGIDLAYVIEQDKPEDIDECMETLQERVQEEEVIYYHNAMEYLAEHDASLQESTALAVDMGYKLEDMNSELLATLLKQQNLASEVEGYRDEIDALFFTLA